jgi:DNA-binding MarR family transcriptional regulator
MPARQKLSKAQYESLAAFRYALRQFLRFSEDAAKRAGLTPQQHQALLAIKGFPGRDWVTVGELAERLQLRHHSTVELVDRLADLKFVARAASQADRRHVHVQLTARGEHVLDTLSSAHERQLRRMGPQLNSLLKRLSTVRD